MDRVLHPSASEARANAAFDALLWALSRPGEVRELPAPGLEVVAECLCDREVSLFSDDDTLLERLQSTGARRAPLEEADFVFVPGGIDAARTAALSHAKAGTLLYPESAATFIVAARIGEGEAMRLSGPGVPGRRDIRIGAVDPAFWAARQAAGPYPLGWDVFLVDDRRVLGLPRSTMIESN